LRREEVAAGFFDGGDAGAEAVEALDVDVRKDLSWLLSVELGGDPVAAGVGRDFQRCGAAERFRVASPLKPSAFLDEAPKQVVAAGVDPFGAADPQRLQPACAPDRHQASGAKDPGQHPRHWPALRCAASTG